MQMEMEMKMEMKKKDSKNKKENLIMKKRDRERRYKSLLEKDYLKAIISDLALRFDFTQNSWMCQTIVDKFNQTLENWEKENHIERLKPGDLLLPYKGELIVVPLFDKGALDILIETKLFQPYKKRMIDKVFNLLKSIDNQASLELEDVYSLISLQEGTLIRRFLSREKIYPPAFFIFYRTRQLSQRSPLPLCTLDFVLSA